MISLSPMNLPFGETPPGIISVALFVACLLAASVSDIRTRRIPNGMVAAFAALGVVMSLVGTPELGTVARLITSMSLGLALWLPFYALGMLGAGDVKLFAAAGAWLGPWQVAQASLIAALAGGVLSLIGMLAGYGTTYTVLRLVHGIRQPSTLMQPLSEPSKRSLPYGVAMAAGLLCAVVFPGFLALR